VHGFEASGCRLKLSTGLNGVIQGLAGCFLAKSAGILKGISYNQVDKLKRGWRELGSDSWLGVRRIKEYLMMIVNANIGPTMRGLLSHSPNVVGCILDFSAGLSPK
jgi:hypothetical protein